MTGRLGFVGLTLLKAGAEDRYDELGAEAGYEAMAALVDVALEVVAAHERGAVASNTHLLEANVDRIERRRRLSLVARPGNRGNVIPLPGRTPPEAAA